VLDVPHNSRGLSRQCSFLIVGHVPHDQGVKRTVRVGVAFRQLAHGGEPREPYRPHFGRQRFAGTFFSDCRDLLRLASMLRCW
jgi:hypothetical protein